MGYPGGPHVITRVLRRGSESEREEDESGDQKGEKNVMLLALNVEKGAMSQGM